MPDRTTEKALIRASLALVPLWGYGYFLSHLSEGWILFSLVPLTAAVVVYIWRGASNAD